MRYVLLVAYDGTNYSGWQIQKNSRTIQGELNRALREVCGTECSTLASGRTDSGVHALGQIVHFDAETSIPANRMADAVNCHLPRDIVVLSSTEAPEGFHAIGSAKKKTYVYRMYFSVRHNPLLDRYAQHVAGACDLDKLNFVASRYVGEHDFRAYCVDDTYHSTYVRSIYSAAFREEQTLYGPVVSFEICGNGFLHKMVRMLVGAALDFMSGTLTEAQIRESFETGNKVCVGRTMPACGLVLRNVDYGFDLFK